MLSQRSSFGRLFHLIHITNILFSNPYAEMKAKKERLSMYKRKIHVIILYAVCTYDARVKKQGQSGKSNGIATKH